MATTILCSGFTAMGRISIGGIDSKVSMTEYAATFQKTVMESKAMWRHATGVNSINRMRGPYIQDIPVISFSFGFEPELGTLQSLFNMIKNQRDGIISVTFIDEAAKANWRFEECYLQSFSFSVTEHSILNAQVQLFVRVDKVYYNYSERTVYAMGDSEIPLTQPIAYYEWELGGSFPFSEVMGFNFNFTQPLIPRYECKGVQDDVAPVADNILFGLPSVDFGVTRVAHKSYSIDYTDDNAGTFMESDAHISAEKVELSCRGSQLIRLTGLVVVDETPEFINGTPKITTRYNIHGKIE